MPRKLGVWPPPQYGEGPGRRRFPDCFTAFGRKRQH